MKAVKKRNQGLRRGRTATSIQDRRSWLGISHSMSVKLQDQDPAILSLKKRKPQLLAEQNGLWYHLWTLKHCNEPIEQSILPKHCHEIVCKLAHTIPLAGRDRPIMLILSPIMLCCSAQNFDLLCSILCSRIRIVLSLLSQFVYKFT